MKVCRALWVCLLTLVAAYLPPKPTSTRSTTSSLRVQGQEPDNGSIHVQLRDEEIGETDRRNEVELCEFVSSSGTTIIASVCSRKPNGRDDAHERTRLEAFSQALLGLNLSVNSTTMVFKTYNLSRDEAMINLRDMFRSERLLSFSKDFPPSKANSDISKISDKVERAQAKFTETLLSMHARRIAYMSDNIGSEEESLEEAAIDKFISNTTLVRMGEGVTASLKDLYAADLEESQTDSRARLKEMLVWFRHHFPYYYSGCQYSTQDCENRDKNGAEYLGCVYPNAEERASRAAVCELYHCSICNRVSRFPRYHCMRKVLETRRGRCGEYSILTLRLLERLGYRARYVVDWEDHVWVEVALEGGRWVHVDSCEASIDEPLIYHGWGKNQTHIYSFRPYRFASEHEEGLKRVEDVTLRYTPPSEHAAVMERRKNEGLTNTTISDAMAKAAELISVGLDPNE
jgi:hypothetical protein